MIAFLPQFNPFNPRFDTKLELAEERNKLFFAMDLEQTEAIAAAAPGIDLPASIRRHTGGRAKEIRRRDFKHFQMAIMKIS
ncbi:MAG: hypothetical protein ACOCXP_00295 [Candidatus Dojkabacteria bacterium]